MMDTVWRSLVAALIWPGLAGGALLGWFYLWLGRKLAARLQSRQGPPFYQPFFDFVKLLGKRTVLPAGVNRTLFYALPLIALAAVVWALALLPLAANPAGSFAGDLVLLIYLLEVPALCDVLAGFVTRSIYAQLGSAREALLSLGYNLPFLAALIALGWQTGSFRLGDLAAAPLGPVHVLAALALLLAVPARLKTTPFSIPNAEQEIVAGIHLEYNAKPLAVFELVHALELVALTGLLAVCLTPPGLALAWQLLWTFGLGCLVVGLTTLLSVATARLKIQHAFRFYWSWGALAAALALAAAAIW